ncbi:MAG: flagellar filament capping protein FliD [Oscillospiraceae bacterium]|nr:flagellar filament capping protein FliD [Oscillospiraceae bacterium]MCI9308483.1 flagellar filament capping protein FliD [Oscillospiraceae bacterium]MCI9547889.1 flagellar filament capping protein FliD [Oscillospiraceae bacterium]
MASITSLSNSNYNTSSIYGNRNVLSGLASGMDTEQMIENAVSGIKIKIQNLIKKRTKVEWQQEAYRSIIDKAVNLNTKYTSFSSKTNLLSSAFFDNAVSTKALGTYKDKISASGKTTSDIKINAVKQMASAASYTVTGLAGQMSGEIPGITGQDEFGIHKSLTVSTVSGSLNFQYGGTNGANFTINFDELEDISKYEGADNAEKLANAINDKLSDVTYTYTKNGFKETTTADKAVKAVAKDGKITFTDGLGNGNKVVISAASGNIRSAFGLYSGENQELKVDDMALTKQMPTTGYLADKTLGVTYNGTTKIFDMGDIIDKAGMSPTEPIGSMNEKFMNALQSELDDAFGKGKVTVERKDDKLSFTPTSKGDTLSLGGTAIEALGFESGDSNFINTGKKLSSLLGEDSPLFSEANRMKGTFLTYDSKPIEKTNSNGTKYYVDDKGNRVDKDGYRVTDGDKPIYDFQVNGAHIEVTKDTTLESVMNSINANPDAGVKASYSKLTNEFKFTATATGANGKIEFGGLAKDMFASHDRTAEDNFSEIFGLGLAEGSTERFAFKLGDKDITASFAIDADDSIEDVIEKLNTSTAFKNEGVTASFDELTGKLVMNDSKTGKSLDYRLFSGDGDPDDFSTIEYDVPEFGSSYTRGQDAIMDVTINGKRFEDLTRTSNSFDIDGLTVNVKGEFETKEGEDPVTFESTTDADTVVEAIKSFVDDYNEMITELKGAYTTQPAEKNKQRYEPLTAEQEEGMTESEIKAYNEKAKQGILFADSTLSSMYSKLLSAITPGGSDGQTLREIGIGTAYENGLTTISLDEDKLRNALESDPDKVKTAFAKTKEGGAATDGLMQTMQNTLNAYVRTTGEPKGVLIARAGSVKAPTSLNSNSLKTQIDNIDNQISRWENKMSDQIDRYTKQFTRLEQLIAEMNSQASAMGGLMGGQSGY